MIASPSLKTLALASLLALAVASPASAAPSYAISSASQNWEGLYGGIHLGLLWGDFGGQSAGMAGPSGSDDNFMGGVQAGYNWQMDRWVVGGEADYSLASIKKAAGVGGSFEENWDSTLRARAGYTYDKWLPYATVGLAMTNTDSKTSGGSVNNTHVGYAIGAGFDYAVLDNLSWRTEFLHYDVPNESDTINRTRFDGGSSNNVIRIGANYRFH